MDSQRNFLIIALLFVSFIIWQILEQEKDSHIQQNIKATPSAATYSTNQNILTTNKEKKIIVKTDVLELIINTQSGNIEQALLLNYLKKLNSKEPFRLLETTSDFVYQAQSGLIGRDSPDNPDKNLYPSYKVDKDIFVLANNHNDLIIPMRWIDIAGNIFVKTFILKRGEYAIDIDYSIENTGNKPLMLSIFGQLKQSIKIPSYYNSDINNFALHTFRGVAYSTSGEKYKKYKFDNIAKNKNLNISSEGGWIAMLQQYFATAWIPCNNSINDFYTTNLNRDIAIVGYKSQFISVYPGQIGHLKSKLWIGPKIQDKMANTAPYLDLTVDYGWLWFISQLLFKLLKFAYSFLGNWGFSIIIVTLIVRGVMYPLTKAQYITMAKMRILQPKIQAIRERVGDDKYQQNQEIIALYKAEKINPLGCCLPLLIQMPIFLALYYMLICSVELRHAPFALWIHDLSAKDQYYILPILMGVTMFFIQKISPTNVTDKSQYKFMILIPIIFTIFFLWFPSGLVIYYTVSNLITIIQQRLIYRSLNKNSSYKSFKKICK